MASSTQRLVSRTFALIALTGIVFAAGLAQALPTATAPNVQMSISHYDQGADPNSATLLTPNVNAGSVTDVGDGTTQPMGTWRYVGNMPAAGLDLSWDFMANADPFVNGVQSVTNLLAVPQIITMNVSIPIFPTIPGATLTGGSIGLSITDSNFDGLGGLSALLGSAIYQGLIDGGTAPSRSLLSDPYSKTFLFGGQTIVDSASFGLPGPTVPDGPVAATIGIRHEFVLSPGDSAALTSFFVVEAVAPEPATWLLLGLGLGALALRRRAV